jgi:alcohol dehydrogenase
MINPFTFARSPHVMFGAGSLPQLGTTVRRYGTHILLVTGAHSLRKSGRLEQVIEHLEKNRISHSAITVSGEPSPDFIDASVTEHKGGGVDAVVAIGGGSVIDAGKALSAMLTKEGSVRSYLEGVGSLEHDGVKLPFIAVPTTSGTGSEATKNAVLSAVGPGGFKSSMRHDNFVPDSVIIDPELMLQCPPRITASCGLDAFTQLLESYVSPKSSPITDALALDGIKYIRDSLLPACTVETDSIDARSGMAYAAFISGVSLANAGLGAVHGFASSIGGLFDVPHGVICGTLLAPCTRKNIEAMRRAGKPGKGMEKYARAGAVLCRKGYSETSMDEHLEGLLRVIASWTEQLCIGKLGDYGITVREVEKIASITRNKNNPVNLGMEDLKDILLESL